jgi:hypothetical protein
MNNSTRMRIFPPAGYILALIFIIVLGSGMPAFAGGIVISEISYNPIDGGDYEFVELYNSGLVTETLGGYQFSVGIAYTFPEGVALAPGEYLVVVRNTVMFQSQYPGVSNVAPGVYTGALDNAGENLVLVNEFGTPVFSVAYDNSGEWPEWADGYGSTLVLKEMTGDPDEPASWCAANELNGNPGEAGMCAVTDVVINEVLTHTDDPLEDAIELYNTTASDIDMGGWYLSDSPDNRKKYRVPDATIIAAGGYKVFYEYQFNSDPGSAGSFALSSTFGDEVFLTDTDASGNLTDFVDMAKFGPSENGIPFGLYPNGQGLFVALENQTFGLPDPVASVAAFRTGLGASNADPKIGPVVISEFMYHPPDIGEPPVNNTVHEYIELHNITDAPVKLYDAGNPENTWKITSAVDFTFPADVTIPADGYILIIGTSDVDGFRIKYGLVDEIPIYGPWVGSLSNSGESIRLKKPDAPDGLVVPYILVDRVDYTDSDPWPTGPDGNGYSLERRTPETLGLLASSWQNGPIAGTPGEDNSPPPSETPVVLINEFLASNDTVDCGGNFSDWIELYNPDGTDPVNLEGYFLTDDLGETNKWTIPVGTSIAPGDFLLFYADGTGVGMNTNFKLSSGGEEIGLYTPEGELVDSIIFGPQTTDVSMGRQPDGAAAWYYFESPTCDATNDTAVRQVMLEDVIGGLQILAGMQPALSVTSGIKADVNGDGRIGMEEVIYILQWLAGLRTEKISFLPGGYESLFTHGNMHHVEIKISQEEWDGLLWDMDENRNPDGFYMKTGKYHKATFIYNGPAGHATIEDVGFRVKGNISRVVPEDIDGNFHRAHFKMRFNHEFDLTEGSDEYTLRKDRRFAGLRALTFRMPSAGNNNWDPSQIRELFCYDVFNRAGTYTSMTGAARLTITIDGVEHYYGVHTLEEPIDQSFLSRRYNSDQNDGNLYKAIFGDSGPACLEPVDGVDGLGNLSAFNDEETRIIGIKDWTTKFRPTYDLKTNEGVADHTVLLDFIENLNSLTENEFETYMDANFEMDRFLRYLAMNFLINRWDDYTTVGNNYYMYFAGSGGKIEFMTTDHDSSLGTINLFYSVDVGIYDWANHSNELVSFLTPPEVYQEYFNTREVFLAYLNLVHDYTSPLTTKIFQIQKYRDLYENYLQEFITPANKLFLYSEYEKKFDLLHALYSPHLDNDIDEGEEMVKEDTVRKFFYDKTKAVIQQLGLNEADYETGPLTLDTPDDVSASDATSSEMITVTWDLVSYADYYRVYRSATADGEYTQVNGDITETTLINSPISPSTTYYYRVKAFTTQGVESDFSTMDEGSTAAGGVTPPTGVQATDGYYSHMVTIAWEEHINADYYRVYRSDTADGEYTQIGGDLTETTVNDKTVVVDTVYYYRVRAFTDEGDTSGYSIADVGFSSEGGMGAPDIYNGAQLIEGTYSVTDANGTTKYIFLSDGTCEKWTPYPSDPNWSIIYTTGTWSYGDDDKELNINTSGIGYDGYITIDMIEVWENAFTVENGLYLHLLPLKKTIDDADGILGLYEARGSVRSITGGWYESDSTTSLEAQFSINADSTWDLIFTYNGVPDPSSGVQDGGNGLISFDGSYYTSLQAWPLVLTRE